MDTVFSNIMDFLTRYPTEVVFLLALLMGFIGLFYYFFRFNRDVFNAQSIVIVVFVFLLFAQVILYFWLNNFLISISVFGVWFIGLAISMGILLLTSKKRIARDRESKIAILPLLAEDYAENAWVAGYGTAEFVSRILQAYDISVVDPYRVAVGFNRRDLSDISKAIEWAKLLKADFLITGDTRFVRDNVQVRYRIINVKDGRERQRKRLLFPQESVFDMGRRMANDLVSLFDLKVSNESGLSYYKYSTNSLMAWQKYCEGRRLQLLAADEDVEQAILLFDEATEIDEDFSLCEIATAEAYLTLARRRVSEESDFLQTLETAYRIALRAVRRHPDIFESQNQMGEVFFFLSGGRDQELFRRAQTRFIEAVRLNPNSAKSWYNLAQISRYSTETEAETGYLGFLEKAVDADPSFVPTRVALARYYIESNNLNDAENEYKAALNFNPNNAQALNELANFYITNDAALKAVAILQRAKEKEERNPTTRFYLGRAFAATGNFIGAEDEFWAAIAFKPSESAPYKSLAELMENQGKYAEAMGVWYEYLSYVTDKTEKLKIERRIKELMGLAQEQVGREGVPEKAEDQSVSGVSDSDGEDSETLETESTDVTVNGDAIREAVNEERSESDNEGFPPEIDIAIPDEGNIDQPDSASNGAHDVGDLIDLEAPETILPAAESESDGLGADNLEDIL